MAWLAVDTNGFEMIFANKPERLAPPFCNDWTDDKWADEHGSPFLDILTPGTIYKWTGKEMTVDDEPIEI